MKLEHHLTYRTGKQIWRILISDSDKVLIEKRDTESRQVYFDCFDLITGDYLFADFQLEEKFWIGIEKVYKDVIFFHKYSKPDMPGHQEILAVDIHSQEILWRNQELIYGFIHDDKVYVFKQQFEGRKYIILDYKTGEEIQEIGTDLELVNKLYDESRDAEDYSDYCFPEKRIGTEEKVIPLINKNKNNAESVLGVEYFVFEDQLFCSYHLKDTENNMIQKFSVFSADNRDEVFTEILCKGTEKIMTDSFFLYKRFLFLLLEKDGLKVYIIDKKED